MKRSFFSLLGLVFLAGCFWEESPEPAPEPAAPERGVARISPSLRESATSAKLQRWALVIGIGDYKFSPGIPDLEYAHRDARAFHDFLRSAQGGCYPERNMLLLLDRSATLENIRAAFGEFLRQAVREDIVVIYFAGHGAPDPENEKNLYLLCYDTKPGRYPSTAYPMWELENALQRYIGSRRVIIITDACHAAGVAEQAIATRGLSQRYRQYLARLAESREGVTTVTASREDEASQESIKWGGGHGVFTYYLLQALRGAGDSDGDGFVTIAEAFDHLDIQVRRATNSAQHPWTSPYVDRTIPLGITDGAVLEQLAEAARESARVQTGPERTGPVIPTGLAERIPEESSKALTMAEKFILRGNHADAEEVVDVVIARRDGSEPRAMALKIDVVLRRGDIDAAERLWVRLSAVYPDDQSTAGAAKTIYDAYLARTAKEELAGKIEVLKDFVRKNPDSPHAAEASTQAQSIRDELRSAMQEALSRHLSIAGGFTRRHQFESARAELDKARELVREASSRHRLALQTEALEAAEDSLTSSEIAYHQDEAYRQAQQAASGNDAGARIAAWEEFLAANPGHPRAMEVDNSLQQLRSSLRAELEKDLERKLDLAEAATSRHAFDKADGLIDEAGGLARRARAEYGLRLDLTRLEQLRSQNDEERTRFVAEAAYADARNRAGRADAEGRIRIWREFIRLNPASPHVSEAREELARLEEQFSADLGNDLLEKLSRARSAMRRSDFEQSTELLEEARELADRAAREWELTLDTSSLDSLEEENSRMLAQNKEAMDNLAWKKAAGTAEERIAVAAREHDGQAHNQAYREAIGAYEAYLERYPAGNHATTARERKAELSQKLGPGTYVGKNVQGMDVYENSIGMKLVLIPAGEFTMGSERGASYEKPVHRVNITKPFYIGVHEVTNAQYRQFQRESGYDGKSDADGNYLKHFSGQSSISSSDNYPIVWVSWKNVVAFCEWLSGKNGEEGWTYRLPTEAEWEYACRAGTTSKYYWGNEDAQAAEYAWYSGNSAGKTHPVGKRRPNAWGFYDMSGNVWEWCADWFDSDYYAGSPRNDPQGPSHGSSRVLRGGSWYGLVDFIRSSRRGNGTPSLTNSRFGFRVVCEVRSAEDSR